MKYFLINLIRYQGVFFREFPVSQIILSFSLFSSVKEIVVNAWLPFQPTPLLFRVFFRLCIDIALLPAIERSHPLHAQHSSYWFTRFVFVLVLILLVFASVFLISILYAFLVCMYVCTCMCMYVCRHVCIYACLSTYIHVFMYRYVSVCLYRYI